MVYKLLQLWALFQKAIRMCVQYLKCRLKIEHTVQTRLTSLIITLYVHFKNDLVCYHCFLGNMFSTVRGHVFEWTLLTDEEAIHQQLEPEAILNFVPFEESSYATDPIIGQLEKQASQPILD